MSLDAALHEGTHCLLRVMGEAFWVQIMEVGDEAVRVSFPAFDYPLPGMAVELEVHEEQGYRIFTSRMIGRGAVLEDGIFLALPVAAKARTHRSAARVETDLPVTVKDQVSVRKFAGQLVNLSQGGALFTTDAPIDFDATVEMVLSLPGEPLHEMLGQVRHVDTVAGTPHRMLGIRFISPDRDAVEAIGRYISLRLRELYPTI